MREVNVGLYGICGCHSAVSDRTSIGQVEHARIVRYEDNYVVTRIHQFCFGKILKALNVIGTDINPSLGLTYVRSLRLGCREGSVCCEPARIGIKAGQCLM